MTSPVVTPEVSVTLTIDSEAAAAAAAISAEAAAISAEAAATARDAAEDARDAAIEAADSVGEGEGSGDVVGPASSADGRAVLFDGTTGKLLKQAGAAPVLEGDGRLTNARPPTEHKSSHATGGSDALTPEDIGAATAAQGTDAREWSATTIDQAEAEAGTATTRRAFTAQRVRQAIAAWWTASAFKIKLDGIATGATANSSDATLLDRANHSGTQAISTVTGLQTALDGKEATGGAAAAVAAHVAAADPHPGYLTPAEGNAAYAPVGQGVTNGNSHNHDGGDGAQIAYGSLSGLPSLHDSVTLAASLTDVLSLTGQALAGVDAGADRILFWDDSEGKLAHLTLGTNLSITDTTINVDLGDVLVLVCSDETTDLATGTAKARVKLPFAYTLTAAKADVNESDPPTGSSLVVDIKEAGTSVLSTKLSIDPGESTSDTAATPAVISDAALASNAEITVDIDQVGSTNPGKGLKITLYVTRVQA